MTDHYSDIREAHEAKILQRQGIASNKEKENLQEPVVVYAVLAYNRYKPSSDNVKGVFDSYSKAEQFLGKFKQEKESEAKGWGGTYYDNYKIVDYILNQPT